MSNNSLPNQEFIKRKDCTSIELKLQKLQFTVTDSNGSPKDLLALFSVDISFFIDSTTFFKLIKQQIK